MILVHSSEIETLKNLYFKGKRLDLLGRNKEAMHNEKSHSKDYYGIIMRKLRLVKWDAFSCGRGRGQRR